MRKVTVLTLLFIALFVGALPTIVPAQTLPYFNSTEAQCTPTNTAGVVFCEDFETPNPKAAPCNDRWGQYADSLVPSGDFDGCSKGWGMHFTDIGIPYPGNAECGAGVTPFGNCAGNHLAGSGSGGSGADHAFYPNRQGYADLYIRWYQKFKSGYIFGAEKMLTLNQVGNGPNGAGIKWGNFSVNCASSASSVGNMTMGVPVPQDQCLGPNVSSLQLTGGNWYALQLRIKLNTPSSSCVSDGGGGWSSNCNADGIVQVWADNCGPSGTNCTGTPTLRFNYTNIKFQRTSASDLIGFAWFEHWSNPASSGETIIDMIKIATQGPIQFAGAQVSATPGTPTIGVTVP